MNILTKRYYLTFLFNIIQNESIKTIFSKMKIYDWIYKITKKNLKIIRIEKKRFLKLWLNSCGDELNSRNKRLKFTKKSWIIQKILKSNSSKNSTLTNYVSCSNSLISLSITMNWSLKLYDFSNVNYLLFFVSLYC